jgi:ABC-type bacteriocin/lantibiotic exporter with double-glycine peptidase domain
VIEPFSLELSAGAKIAVQGAPGSGKSTLADLIYGLSTPTQGSIELDAMDSRSLSLESVRENVGLLRGIQLIQGSVQENLSFGRETVSTGDAMRVVDQLGLRPSILGLPEGFETHIYANGYPLSQSQSVLLSVARVLVQKPRLILVDGTLDALAPETRETVLRMLTAPDAPWTLIVLTQDQSIASRFESVYELRQGRLAKWTAEVPSLRLAG